jgi:hypothetical protein
VPDTPERPDGDAVLPEVELDHECLNIRRILAYSGRKGFDVVTPLTESVGLGKGESYPCILIPADERSTPLPSVRVAWPYYLYKEMKI